MSKYLIVGGVAGGATTAARLRRLDENAEIILFERGQYVSFANCGLPYYIGETITEREKLFVMSAERLHQRLNIDIRINQEVISIDRKLKKVAVKDLKSEETYWENYDKLVLSPGAEPLKPLIPGINNDRIFTLRNVPDTDRIKGYIDQNQPKKAIIVGAGFIGLEMAENLHQKEIEVTIVEMADQVMAPLDYEMAAEVHRHLRTKQVEFYLKDGVSSFNVDNNAINVSLNSGRVLSTDMVILSIGVSPESKLAKEAGLGLTEKGGIIVNEYLQTDDPHIYAIGDAIAYPHPIINKKVNTLLAGPANRQGRITADNIIYNNIKKYKGAIGTAIAKVFDITVASTGIPEKMLKKEGIDFISSIIHTGNHAGYYPGAIPMTLKIIFSPETGQLLGAQIVGFQGVDKRIDIIATILGQGGTVYDLQDVEHAYAPPYSSAKDPVNIAGYAAENIIKGLVKITHWHEIIDLKQSDTFLLDVRTADEYKLGSIDGSVNIPLDEIRDRLEEIPGNKNILIFCAAGLRGYFAARILTQKGFDQVSNLSGGYKTYEIAIGPQSNEDIFDRDEVGTDDLIYTTNKKINSQENVEIIEIDACGLQCPGPIIKLKKEIDRIKSNTTLSIKATDPGFKKDVQAWCHLTGHQLINLEEKQGITIAKITKNEHSSPPALPAQSNRDKTIIVFSDDFDRAMATFIIANGAASTGNKVSLFFTFWGLNLLKKNHTNQKVKKDFMGKMFNLMLPSHSNQLKLSKMNLFGMGTAMMKKIMKSKNIDSIDIMLRTAAESGIEMIACQMSMDVMGLKKEELHDFVKIGGVASYLEAAEDSNLNLFI